MSAHKAEAFDAGTVDGHTDAQNGWPLRRGAPGPAVKARDGNMLIHDEADANAYLSGYLRSYQDERENQS